MPWIILKKKNAAAAAIENGEAADERARVCAWVCVAYKRIKVQIKPVLYDNPHQRNLFQLVKYANNNLINCAGVLNPAEFQLFRKVALSFLWNSKSRPDFRH